MPGTSLSYDLRNIAKSSPVNFVKRRTPTKAAQQSLGVRIKSSNIEGSGKRLHTI